MKAKLQDGFEIELIEESLGDWEFLEVLNDIDEGETGLIVKAARMLLGKNGVNQLKEHLRGEDNKIAVADMADALRELMESVDTLKNSEPSPA
ncbi:MAG: hypothetical protein IIY21_26565 [Clostridiales bacterium]|jgi:hypothetical protein|nr:hypothetical protein [Clostridiales bacterium]MBQ1329664.1 hypothetical protein [Mogibacterium sp.]MBQ1573795.1 hypothetical protein [Clostridiales bacterium]